MDNIITSVLLIVIAYKFRSLYLSYKAPSVLPQEIATLKKETRGKMQIIDVRSARKYKKNHVKGAKNIHLSVISNHMEKMPKDKKIVLVSTNGTQTGRLTMMMRKRGYDAVNLKGGHRAYMKYAGN